MGETNFGFKANQEDKIELLKEALELQENEAKELEKDIQITKKTCLSQEEHQRN